MLPTITDYVHALEDDYAVFRTLGRPVLRRDGYGEPEMIAGNSAVVFPYTDPDGGHRFLKCYIRPTPHLKVIYDYVAGRRPALLPEVRLLPGELFVGTPDGSSTWVDVVEGAWTQGVTLAKAISAAATKRDRRRLGQLAEAFDDLWWALERCEWAHGDLKPENIVVGTSGELSLIDCDAMWIPALRGARPAELGTPPWRDPAREAGLFDKSIDDHPARLLSAALHSLALDPDGWSGYSRFEERVGDMSITSPVRISTSSRSGG